MTTTLRIAHLSDLHLGPLSRVRLRELIGKRATGFINWHQARRDTHSAAVAADVVADIHGHAPDHIAVTGDLTNIGLPAEFAVAREFMTDVGTPQHVSFVPGNHDFYVRASLAPMMDTLGDWMMGDDAARGFPWVHRHDGFGIIGLNSAEPTLPLLATGRLGREQLARAAAILDQLASERRRRIIVVHHAPHVGGSRRFRELRDAAAFEAMLKRHGADLVLHGHNHRTSVAHRAGPSGPVPIVGVGSASASGGTLDHRASWHLVTLRARDASCAIEIRKRSRDGIGAFTETTLAL